MPYQCCPNCTRGSCCHFGCYARRTITVATDAELQSGPYRNRLKLAVLNAGIGGRVWPTKIQHVFLKADGKGLRFQHAPKPFEIPLVDDVWGNERYVRRFLESQTCEHPEKDRLIDLYFRLKHPEIARHFGR